MVQWLVACTWASICFSRQFGYVKKYCLKLVRASTRIKARAQHPFWRLKWLPNLGGTTRVLWTRSGRVTHCRFHENKYGQFALGQGIPSDRPCGMVYWHGQVSNFPVLLCEWSSAAVHGTIGGQQTCYRLPRNLLTILIVQFPFVSTALPTCLLVCILDGLHPSALEDQTASKDCYHMVGFGTLIYHPELGILWVQYFWVLFPTLIGVIAHLLTCVCLI